jgi:hypothetical protein
MLELNTHSKAAPELTGATAPVASNCLDKCDILIDGALIYCCIMSPALPADAGLPTCRREAQELPATHTYRHDQLASSPANCRKYVMAAIAYRRLYYCLRQMPPRNFSFASPRPLSPSISVTPLTFYTFLAFSPTH